MARSLSYAMKENVDRAAMNNNTRKAYDSGARHFQKFVTDSADFCKRDVFADPQKVIQAYADKMVADGLSPATIHTRLYAPCKAFSVPMGDIKKPVRTAGDITRSGRDSDGRKLSNAQGASEAAQERFSRLVTFQGCVGIRRAELAHLTASDVKYDESGHFCVVVERGKGGKYQLQRVLPQDEETVRAIFAGAAPDGRVFSADEMANKIDLHGMRAQVSRSAYDFYASRLRNEPGYRETLQRELMARWDAMNPSAPKEARDRFARAVTMKQDYTVRGSVRSVAEELGRPVSYDRTAVMAVSVFHLSHWRADVTVAHYLVK